MKRNVFLLSLLIVFASLSFAQNMSNVNTALEALCGFIYNVMPVLAMLMVVGAGAAYALGQMMGAETRARANVWATAMLVGALIGILIIVIGPFAMSTMYGSNWGGACAGAGGEPPGPCNPNLCPRPPPDLPTATSCCRFSQTTYICYTPTRNVCCPYPAYNPAHFVPVGGGSC